LPHKELRAVLRRRRGIPARRSPGTATMAVERDRQSPDTGDLHHRDTETPSRPPAATQELMAERNEKSRKTRRRHRDCS